MAAKRSQPEEGVEKNAGECHRKAKRKKSRETGCNHHEMMVATEKRNPVNIIFYLSKVISAMFLDSVRTPRFPKLRKIHTRLKETRKEPRTKNAGNPLPFSIPFIVHNFTIIVQYL